MTNLEKVSVVIPAYNIETYLESALQSLISQTFEHFEVIIVDDGSTDKTHDIAKQFCYRDNRFKVVCKPNGGLSSARNYGIRHANSEYIALLDADDIYRPRKIETHVAILEQHASVGVVYSASQAIRDDGKSIFISLSGKPVDRNPLKALLFKNFIGHGSNAIFRRSIFYEVGEFDETLRSSEDIDFWLRIAGTQNWTFYRVPEKLSCYRVRPSGLSFNIEGMQTSHEAVLQAAYQRFPQEVKPILPTAYAYLYRYLARLCMSMGDGAQAKKFIILALKQDASIFYRDPRSFLTILSVALNPIASLAIKKVLGT
ncbi:MAG: glycosyltransferase [Cyanobacteria bacterium J06639_14]